MHSLFQLAARSVCVSNTFQLEFNPVVIKVQSPVHMLLAPPDHTDAQLCHI